MEALNDLPQRVPPSALLGYLNFSDGRPDPRFQRALNDSFAHLAAAGEPAPWLTLRAWLLEQASALQASGSAAFKDVTQAGAVVELTLGRVLKAYREHHADLLSHQPDAILFGPFFLTRAFEAVLRQGGPWQEDVRIVTGAIRTLNDYVGHRPIAVLETRAQTELYPHERVRPLPMYIRGVGAGYGPYQLLVEPALQILRTTDADILAEAHFELELMDELAFDPRGFDHAHPANRRPNYLFGEWDPHVIDGQGRYRRFVMRQPVLDALLSRMRNAEGVSETRSANKGSVSLALLEASAVLAGTILMASGISGEGPTTHDSDARLATLVPRIARYRDAFYSRLLEKTTGPDGDKLRAEAKRVRQPFGGIRQHLNQELARQRAAQLQHRHLALAYAELGYPAASRSQAAHIPSASVRLLAEIRLRQTSAELAVHGGHIARGAALLPEIEDLLERGIDCGALADPWNILGFQGLFPLFHAREDSVHDPRNEDLIETVSRQFDLYARLLAAAAASADEPLRKALAHGARRLAGWWDRFAAYEVSDVPRLHGGERAEAALHVAEALAKWAGRARSATVAASADLAFWREQREGFTSPAAFAQVIDALLRQQDWRAAQALLVTWLSEAETIPLGEGDSSFHRLAERWVEGVIATVPPNERATLVHRFFQLIQSNGEMYWSAPALQRTLNSSSGEEEEDRYSSAYEDVVYRDSTDDGEEGAVIGDGPLGSEFALEEDAKRIEQHLEFLKSVARLWHAAASSDVWKPLGAEGREALAGWLSTARGWRRELLDLLDREYEIAIPTPSSGEDELIEYEKHRHTKDDLIDTTLAACVETGRAVQALASLLPPREAGEAAADLDWEPAAAAILRAVRAADIDAVRAQLPIIADRLDNEPLLFVPVSEGGHPRPIVRAKATLAFLMELLQELPKIGLVRETYHLVKTAKSMEQNGPPQGRKVSEFDQLFRVALRSVVEALLAAAERSDREAPKQPEPAKKPLPPAPTFTDVLRKIADSFLNLWIAHSNTLRLSALEGVGSRDDWEALRKFVKTYGRELFTASFMTYANLRGILHRGVGDWLDSLADGDGPGRPEKLLADLEKGRIQRQRAMHYLEVTLQAVTEHYEEYKDYNSTTTQSDYGENLHVLLDFLRLKVNHDRFAWRMQPLVQAHEVLCRKGYGDMAEHWRKSIAESSRELTEKLLAELAGIEAEHAMRVRTVRDALENGFVAPLRIDRLCSLARPAAQAAREGLDEKAEAFKVFEEAIQPFLDNPSGVGLDAPPWMRRLEAELTRLREAAEPSPAIPRDAPLTLIDLQRQLAEWEKPLAGE